MSGSEATTDQAENSVSQPTEPVSFSGSIQPHGILLVLHGPDLTIVQVSANTPTYFGVQPQMLLGQSLSRLLGSRFVETLRQGLEEGNSVSSLKLVVPTPIHEQTFDATLHQTVGGILLELEPVSPQTQGSGLSAYGRVKQAIAQLRQVSSLAEFFQLVAENVRKITGFDRVMVYQFDSRGAGTVVAEAKRNDLPAYLGLHYPATDIPEPVRELYQCGLLRFIPDLMAPAIELVPAENPITQQPLDLSQIVLRSVDPCCVEYHQNMGVAAILVISLIHDQKLWGLISCHHQSPKSITYEVREACEVLGQFVSSELANQLHHEELDYISHLRSLQSKFVESIAQVDDLTEALVNPAPRLLDLVSAQGAAVCLEGEITLVGVTPTVEQVRGLIQWAAMQVNDLLFHTDSLSKFYPDAEGFQAVASGLLLLRISQVRRYYILWFRPEVLQTITWAGDPYATVTVDGDGSVRLSPRKSFEQWQETVRFTSLPWKICELENALDLRNAIVGIVLKKADELTQINQELERRNRELDSFAYAASHDLKEPLRGIHNFSMLLLKGYGSVLDEVGQSRLRTLIRLTRRMEALIDTLLKFSRLGQAELHLQSTDLNCLVEGVLEDLHVSREEVQPTIRIPRSLPTVSCDPVLLSEVFTNLLSNAFKYNDQPNPWVEIGYLDTAAQVEKGWVRSQDNRPIPPVLYVQDNGIGIRERHHETIFRLFKRLHEQHLYGGGTGAGLTIAKKIIERHGGRIWVESTYGEGSTFYFTLE